MNNRTIYHRKWRRRNREKLRHKKRSPEYMLRRAASAKRRYQRKRREFIEWKRKYCEIHPCVDCGEKDIVVLEFDHVRGKKLFVIGSIRIDKPWEAILTEVEKCDVRCANCHRRRHAKEREQF